VPSVAERTALAAAEITRLGAGAVSTEPGLVAKVSSDWSRMSPVLQEKIPPGHYLADVVMRPTEPEQVPVILKVAFDHDVPVTPRGAGTGNYGQATPFDGGILLDLRDLRSITVNDGGTITADAGAPLTEIDKVARAAGRDIWIFPSTKGSTVGGFVGGGSAGTGTIERGTTSDGFVVAVTVAPMDGGGRLITYGGDAATPYIHTYGVTGILVDVEIRTDPARDWSALYADFATYDALVAVHRTLLDLPALPRLASGDEPALVPTLPAPMELDATRFSLRVIAESSTSEEILSRVRGAGGRVVADLADYAETDKLSGMSYNHPVYFLQQAHPERSWFHMETGGTVHWDDPDAVRAIYDGPVSLHLELMGNAPLAMVVAEYESEEKVLAGMTKFDAVGARVHSPHQWYVDRNVALAIETAKSTDPEGLLNPGKLVAAPPVDTRLNIGVR
jgi:hypothetical protein